MNDSNISIKKYNELYPSIRSGDILLCSGTAIFSKLIQKVTKSIWSHVGFILHLKDIDRLIVLESVENIGVRVVPLIHYINNYDGNGNPYSGKILIARHNKFEAEDILKLSTHAVDLLGYPYDKEEIVKIAQRICLGTKANKDIEGKQTSYICSEYAYECYKSIGIEINKGTNDFVTPADFFNDQNVTPLAYVDTK